MVKEIAASFPKNKIIIEILEDVPPSPDVLAACRFLSQQGYILALDDFVYSKELLPLIELVNIIKISTPPFSICSKKWNRSDRPFSI